MGNEDGDKKDSGSKDVKIKGKRGISIKEKHEERKEHYNDEDENIGTINVKKGNHGGRRILRGKTDREGKES